MANPLLLFSQASIFKPFRSNHFCVAFFSISLFSSTSALPPVIFKIYLQRTNPMTQQTAKPSFINQSVRCAHLYPNGRRCRLYATANSSFCPAHAPLPANQPDAAEIASTLTVNLDDFTSAAQINDFLSRLLLLLAQDKISTRRAAVLAYITNQLLCTLPASPKRKTPSQPKSSSTCPAPSATASGPTRIPRSQRTRKTAPRTTPQSARRSPHDLRKLLFGRANPPLFRRAKNADAGGGGGYFLAAGQATYRSAWEQRR